MSIQSYYHIIVRLNGFVNLKFHFRIMSAWSRNLNILGLQLDTSTSQKLQDDEIRNTKADDSLDISGVEEDTHWSCELCSYSNKDKSNFNKHVKTHQLDPNSTNCNGKKLYVCSQCTKPATVYLFTPRISMI